VGILRGIPAMVVVIMLHLQGPVNAAQLAARTYSEADGLPADQVESLFQDSRGFLWIGTGAGLARFDGSLFVRYSTADGLPHPNANDVAEDARGTIWVATSNGVARMRPSRSPDGLVFDPFPVGETVASNIVRQLLVDDDILWVAAGRDLYTLDTENPHPSITQVESLDSSRGAFVLSLAKGQDGSLWVGTTQGLCRLLPGGRLVEYPTGRPEWKRGFASITTDRLGRVWAVGHEIGTLVLYPEPPDAAEGFALLPRATIASRPSELPRAPGNAALLGSAAGLPTEKPIEVMTAADGSIWLATFSGLFRIDGDGIHRYGTAQGLIEEQTSAVFEDRDGSLWIGGASQGLMRVSLSGFTNYGTDDGLATRIVASVISDRNGDVLAIGFPPAQWVHRLVGDRFVAVHLPLPDAITRNVWGLHQVTFVDHLGDWWVPTTRGLYRFPQVPDITLLASSKPRAVYGLREIGTEDIFRLFEDSRHDIWIGPFGEVRLARWERSTGAFHRYGPDNGLPYETATCFAEDSTGSVWIGFYAGGVARYNDGQFQYFDEGDGVPGGFVFALYCDSEGRLWIGSTRGGLGRIDEPAAERPAIVRYTVADGLAADGIFSIVEDRWGRIYAGSFRGLDRLDPASGHVEHFSTDTGLINNKVISACADTSGDLWFATDAGVSRLHPTLEKRPPPAQVRIDSLVISGLASPIPELGLSTLGPLKLPVGTNHIEVGFGAVNLVPGLSLSYQHALGTPPGPWGKPTAERRLHLAGLGSGAFTLRIRSLRSDGQTGPPAILSFVIPPPFWQRWWFLTVVALALAGAVWAAHRARVGRLIALEKVRARIASDLHDELGLNLSRISILSEVARQSLDEPEGEVGSQLTEIGDSARELIDATSDMAWALDPRQDSLGSVLARLRRVAHDVFEGAGVHLDIHVDPNVMTAPLGAEARRHLFLVVKEALHNAARHGRPSAVSIEVEAGPKALTIEIRDDGRGFDPAAETSTDRGGHGLASMMRRIRAINGTLTLASEPGSGTTVTIIVPWSVKMKEA
jgi:signal transduction histidine kinase/ligand-binding sensor domain-containing protein